MTQIDIDAATAIVRQHIDPTLSVRDMRQLTGGMIHRVEAWTSDGEPGEIVAKMSPEPNHEGLREEAAALAWYGRNTAFPVPRPFACATASEHFAGTCLLMEKLRGRHLGEARLSPAGMARFQQLLARHLAELHGHRRDTYGSVCRERGPKRWLDWFSPKIQQSYSGARHRLRPQTRRTVESVLNHLDAWLPEFGEPTLVHGDLWAANILVDDRDPDDPAISGYVDGGAGYTDVEYELAYLRVFDTADRTFFREYGADRRLREGFGRRCRVYWLHTLLIHVGLFGAQYLPRCEQVVRELERQS